MQVAGTVEALPLNSEANTSKLSSALTTALQNSGEDDAIPVYIWLSDISQQEVEQVVEAQLGYSREDLIAESVELASTSAAENIAVSNSFSQGTEFQQSVEQYLQATEAERKVSQAKMHRYIDARCREAKARYIEQNSETISQLGLQEAEVIFVSEYSPMIIADLSVAKIEDIEDCNNVASIEIVEAGECIVESENENAIADETALAVDRDGLDRMRAYYGIDTIHEAFGLTGESVEIGFVETGSMRTDEELPAERCSTVGTSTTTDHATWTARVAGGTRGVAPGATLYSCGCQRDDEGNLYPYPKYFYQAVELLLDEMVTVINCSCGIDAVDGYTPFSQWFDHVASVHGVTIVASAGNNGSNYNHGIDRPADAYNVIAVGAYIGMGTKDTTDDELFGYSSYKDKNGVAKPDLVAPADFGSSGTSTAAPFVTGVVALMMELQPALSLQPHVVKAILLASCQRKVNAGFTEAMSLTSSSLTNKQGAGAIDPIMALAITSAGNYGFGEMAVDDTVDQVYLQQPAYNSSGMTVALTWLHESVANEDNLEQDVPLSSAAMPNMALTVKQNNATVVSSNVENSSAEFVYLSPSSVNNVYTLEIQKGAIDTTVGDLIVPTRYAYAWAVTEQQFQYQNNNKGIHYLKNCGNQQYLGIDSTGVSLTQSTSFSATESFQWILKKDPGYYQLHSGTGLDLGITINTSPTDGNYSAMLSTLASATPLFMVPSSSGKYGFYQTMEGKIFAMTTVANSTVVQWEEYSETDVSQQWFFERCCWQNGDINTDGQFDMTDVDLLMSYASTATENWDGRKNAFADINGDGMINMTDAMRLCNFVGGQTTIL